MSKINTEWKVLPHGPLKTVDDRILTAGTGALAAWAYRDPRAQRTYVPPPSPPEHHLFRR